LSIIESAIAVPPSCLLPGSTCSSEQDATVPAGLFPLIVGLARVASAVPAPEPEVEAATAPCLDALRALATCHAAATPSLAAYLASDVFPPVAVAAAARAALLPASPRAAFLDATLKLCASNPQLASGIVALQS
jgi:hypothetical protein